MDVDGFERWWRSRERADIEWIMDALAAATDTADGEVERWRAMREIARVLARSGRRREACAASHRVRLCALAACSDTGVRAVDPDGATLVCRAAGDAAMGLVAGVDQPCSEMLLRPFVGAPAHA
ncbi:MAG: hypothetical protein U5K30_15720 [Acidimicrobiales bacterium]|nr:hypothetical protein [Acidimicrobiales bacterium]